MKRLTVYLGTQNNTNESGVYINMIGHTKLTINYFNQRKRPTVITYVIFYQKVKCNIKCLTHKI